MDRGNIRRSSFETFLTQHLIIGMIKDADNIYYCTKYQVRGLCVGGDMLILFIRSIHDEMIISPHRHNPRT